MSRHEELNVKITVPVNARDSVNIQDAQLNLVGEYEINIVNDVNICKDNVNKNLKQKHYLDDVACIMK